MVGKFVFAALALLALAGCADYKFGDVSRKAMDVHARYCSATSAEQRAYIIAEIRQRNPSYKPVCGN